MPTYKPLQSVFISTATSSITFSGIDQNYTDLIVVSSIKVTAGTPVVQVLINSDTNSNYSRTGLYGDGSTATGYKETSISSLKTFSADSTNFTPMTLHFGNYSNTTTNKSILTRSGITYPTLQAGLYRSTAAITSLTINLSSSTFQPGCTFDLYGIKAGSVKAIGGDLVTTDGNYWYHVYTNTGTFTPTQSLSCEVTSNGGGGGGGWNNGGGGGGAELKINSSLSVTAQAYTVTIGSGGAGSTGIGSRGGTGTSSTITIGGTTYLTALGGGGGGTSDGTGGNNNGATGGSGGGSSISGTAGGASGSNTFAGGLGAAAADNYSGGGGGGATAAGANGTLSPSKGGNGGEGYSTTNMSGISNLYSPAQVWSSGGGGGNYSGTKGLGGTGAGNGGQGSTVATVGTTYGSGGGGGGYPDPYRNGAAGAKGILIVRYPV